MSFSTENFTERTSEALSKAHQLAVENKHIQVSAIHLAVVLFSENDELGAQLVSKLGVDKQTVDRALRKLLVKQSTQDPPPPQLQFSNQLYDVLQKAQKLQKDQGDSHLAVDHLLLALVQANKEIASTLEAVGISKKQVEATLKQIRGGRRVDSKTAEDTYEALAKYG